ncbi:hypothetical protein M3Y99_00725000 [Aphelenchoides fujianensis]|nr:hypothetical protein M3Y99_00725000 [Aphelenchoides fujianensis]
MSAKLVLLLVLPYALVRVAEGGGYAPAPNCCNLVCCCPSCGNDCQRSPPIGFGGCNCQGCSGGSWQQTIHGVPNTPPAGYRPGGPSWISYGQFPPPIVSIPPVPYQPSAQPAPPLPVGYPTPSLPAPPPTVKPSIPSYQTAAPPAYVSPVPPKYPTAAPQSYASPPSPAPSLPRPPVYASPPPPPSYVSPPPAPTYVPRPPPIAPAPVQPPFYPVGPPAVAPCGGPCNCEPCPGFWQMLWDFFTHGWGLALLIASLILLFLLCFLIGVLAFRQMQKRHDDHRRRPLHATVRPIGDPNVHSRVVNQSPNQV